MKRAVVRGGVAIGMDRRAALRLAIRCARDSMPPLRLAIIDDVAVNPESSTADIRKRLGKPRATVDRQLQALHMLDVLACDEQEFEWIGKPATRWYYQLAEGIEPTALDPKSVPDLALPTPNPQRRGGQNGDTAHVPPAKSGTAPPAAVPDDLFTRLERSGLTETPPNRPIVTGPGRCTECGFHSPTQGHRDGCSGGAA